MTEYRWKPGSRIPIKADVAGPELRRIEESYGQLTPSLVVQDSEPDDAPLHEVFEWRDKVAGPLYREQQAFKILRSITVRVEPRPDSNEPVFVRAFLPVKVADEDDEDGKRSYTNIARIFSDDDLRQQVLDRALEDLNALRKRYAVYRELAPVWSALEQVQATVAEREAVAV